MGQQPNKYHISDDGKVYRINEDGSFTSVGNIEDIEMKSSATSADKMPPNPTSTVKRTNTSEVEWWKRDYNYLWVLNLAVFIGWFILCLLYSTYPDYYSTFDDYGNFVENCWYSVNNTAEVFAFCTAIVFCYGLSWYLSKKDKTILKLSQILLVGCAIWIAFLIVWLCSDPEVLLVSAIMLPFSIWTVTICLSLFGRKHI